MITGYRRRRGWAVWQTAVLGRFEFKDGFPKLHEMTGQQPAIARQTPAQILHAIDLWGVVLEGKGRAAQE